MQKSDDNVCHLRASIVDVVLNIHFPAGKLQQADKRVAEDGIAQVADMGGFVGIDAGVLDQNFAGRNVGARGFRSAARAAASSSRLSRALM